MQYYIYVKIYVVYVKIYIGKYASPTIFKTAIRAEKISLKTLNFFRKMLDKAFRLCYYNKALKISSRGVAQLVAHVVWDHGVGSSSLFTPTTKKIRAFSSVG